MNRNGWICARVITLVGIMVGLDNFLPAATPNAQAESLNVKPGAMMPLLRFALSGQSRGPGVTTIAHLIGREATLQRIARTLSEVLA